MLRWVGSIGVGPVRRDVEEVMAECTQETEEITIVSTWRAAVRVEVPLGWRPGENLSDWPDDVVDQVTTQGAELVDWAVG